MTCPLKIDAYAVVGKEEEDKGITMMHAK